MARSRIFGRWLLTSLTVAFLAFLPGCEKDPGTGGKSTLYGKVFVKDYNATFTVMNEAYYGPGFWVYIVYGDGRGYSDRIQTGPDGTWEFRYLRPGNYTVYALSKDSTLSTNALIPVLRNVEIPSGRQEIEVPDLVIFD